MNPLRRMVDFLNAAQKGDYSASLPVTSAGEMGELERALNRLVAELRENRDRWEEQKAMQRELKISQVIQSTLLPTVTPEIPEVEVLSLYRPARQIGGDYYDFIEIDSDHVGIAIADVAGKSVSGAMLMTITRSTLRAQAMLTLSPVEVLERTQRLLLPNMMRQFFVSVFYAVVDKRTKTITCANAGHPPLLWYHFHENRSEWIRPEGIAIGLLRDGSRPVASEEKEFRLDPGDLAFFYTDGITDLADPQGVRFGRDRLAQLAVEIGPQGGQAFLSTLENRLASFGEDLAQGDDMTAVLLHRKRAN